MVWLWGRTMFREVSPIMTDTPVPPAASRILKLVPRNLVPRSRVQRKMVQPDFKEFSRLARSATLVPVVKSVSADLLTPVSAFLAVAEKEPHAFLLESNERGEQIGRYTFLGARPYMRLRARGSTIEIQRGRKHERHEGNVFEFVKLLLSEHQPAAMPG